MTIEAISARPLGRRAAREGGWWNAGLEARLRGVAVRIVLPGAFVLLWQVAANRGWMSAQTLASPAQVFATFVDLVRSGDIANNLAISLRRIALGFGVGSAAGLMLGALLGLSRTAEDYVGPIFRGFAAVPSLGWLPILILIFGIDETLKVLIIAKASMVPIVLNTSQGIRNVPLDLLEAARVLRLRRRTTFSKLIVPATLPTIFSGVRLASSHAFIALIVAEMLAATEGIGYMMTWGRTLFQIDIVMVGMIVVGALGFAIDFGLRRIEAALSRWSPAHE
jgi:sulfonate transport system permease protein